MQQHDRIEATFQPRRTDDLKPGASECIGLRTVWYVAWPIEEHDSGPYAGEFACMLVEPPEQLPGFVWVPSGDLSDIDVLPTTDEGDPTP